MSADRTIDLPDGRTLGFAEYGDLAGVPVIALHGTPGSRLKFADSDQAARKRGLRIIAVDRWGYGLSSPKLDATLEGFGAEMVALAEALKIKDCALLGVSGGGPYATAAAVAFGSNLKSLALVAPVGPIEPATLLSPIHRACFRLLPRLGAFVGAGLQVYRSGLLSAPELAVRMSFAMAARVDREALANPVIRHGLAQTFIAGLRPGVSGVLTDIALFSRPWDIDPSCLSSPAKIWIGAADRNVPQAATERLAGAIPGCEYERLARAGHLWIAKHGDEVLAWIAAYAR